MHEIHEGLILQSRGVQVLRVRVRVRVRDLILRSRGVQVRGRVRSQGPDPAVTGVQACYLVITSSTRT